MESVLPSGRRSLWNGMRPDAPTLHSGCRSREHAGKALLEFRRQACRAETVSKIRRRIAPASGADLSSTCPINRLILRKSAVKHNIDKIVKRRCYVAALCRLIMSGAVRRRCRSRCRGWRSRPGAALALPLRRLLWWRKMRRRKLSRKHRGGWDAGSQAECDCGARAR